ncbi:MAG TPA: aminodeoxychorismate synthase component I [Bacteroidales bacterium]|nr:aminodeoxychorismate synthase component I [Bacteroidales bacterium]
MNYKGEISKKISERAKSGSEFLFVIDFDCSEYYIFTPEEAAINNVFYDFEGKTNYSYNNRETNISNKYFNYSPIDFQTYFKGFNRCKEALHRGDTYLINLTFQTPLETDYSLEEIFVLSNAKFKLFFKNRFVVFSPERFIRISDGKIETTPMKGTIDASIPFAEEKLLDNKKELFEHNTIVDLLRNDLNLVAHKVSVEKFRYIDYLNTNKCNLLQMSSVISGQLSGDYNSHLGEIICKLLPAGSVTGAPKEKTVRTILEAENYKRGFYTGVFGYFDGKNTDVAVSIRFVENVNGQFLYKSGGGITALSDPKEEYDEMLKKIYVPVF